MEDSLKNIVYSKGTIEFTTVAVQFCAYIETFEDIECEEFTDKLTKILPLLYLKTALVPETEAVNEEEPEMAITEGDYNYILARLANIFGKDDSYLEVFLQDMKYSDTPIVASIAEDLTDIYQDLKNFITIYERGITENMNDALYLCFENFKSYWGQKLVNVLRALHSLKYSTNEEELDNDDDLDAENEADIW